MQKLEPVLHVAEVAEAVGGRVVARGPQSLVTHICTDSRACGAGGLFVALRGPRHDGHDFAREAARRGASAVLVERPVDCTATQVQVPNTRKALLPLAAVWRRKLGVRVVAVTGSVGKSTTVQMVAAVLRTCYPTGASRPEWNAELGLPLALFLLRAEHRYAVLEMAMRGLGQIASLCEVAQPVVGVVTRVGAAHTEQLGSVDHVARAKAELVRALPRDGVAVLNHDDPRVRAMARATAAQVVYYGTGPDAHVRAEDLAADPSGVRFRVHTPAGSARVRLPLPSVSLVHNALAALAVGLTEGVSLHEAVAALEGFTPPPMRLQVVRLADDVLLVNDAYNSSPLSVEAALEAVRTLRTGRRVVAVLGEMRELGPLQREAHRQVGIRCAQEGVDLLVAVGEGARELLEAARAAGIPEASTVWCPDAEAAARWVAGRVRAGDLLLVKGSRAVGLERVAEAVAQR